MSSFDGLSCGRPGDGAVLAELQPGQREELARLVERERCRSTVQMAELLRQVDAAGLHLVDGHRSVHGWAMAACNLSASEASGLVRLGAMLARFPQVAVLAADGGLGLGQLHALARVVANPRVRDHLTEVAEALFVEQAQLLDAGDFAVFCARWESAADADGAHDRHERAHRHRRAQLHLVGERCWLDAAGGVAAGVQLKEILDAFARSEWLADWDEGVARHGEAMNPAMLARSDAQRRFDALVAVFHAAAAATASGSPAATVNLVVGYDTFVHHFTAAVGGQPAPLRPGDPGSRCETTGGVQVDPRDMLVAAATGHVRRVVLDSQGVVVDLGRRQRLFTGPLREAVLLSGLRCFWPGCNRPAGGCQADHVLPYSTAGPTRTTNGAPRAGTTTDGAAAATGPGATPTATGTTTAPTAPNSAGAPPPEPGAPAGTHRVTARRGCAADRLRRGGLPHRPRSGRRASRRW
jgi:hypothetical protein